MIRFVTAIFASLLLAGPALSLPNMLVIRSVMGTKKTLVYVLHVVVLSTILGRTPSIDEYVAAVDGIKLTSYAPPAR